MALDKLTVQIEADTSRFKKQVKDVKKQTDNFKKIPIEFSGLDNAVEEIKKKVQKATINVKAQIKPYVDIKAVQKNAKEILRNAQGIKDPIVKKLDIDIDEKKAQKKLKDVEEALKQVYSKMDSLYKGNSQRQAKGTLSFEDKEKDAKKLADLTRTASELEKLQAKLKFNIDPKVKSEKIEELKDRLLEAMEAKKQLESVMGSTDVNSDEYSDYVSKLAQAEDNISNIRQALAEEQAAEKKSFISSRIQGFKKAISGITKVVKAIGKAFLGVVKVFTKPFTAALKGIGNGIKRIGKLFVTAFVFNVVRDKFKDIKDEINGLFSNNEGLQNALKQLSDSVYMILGPLINAFMPVLTQLINMISVLASKIAVGLSGILGKTLDQTKEEAQAMKDAAKAADLSTASFDELNQIGTKEESEDTGITTDVAELADTELTGIWEDIERIGASLAKLIKPIVKGVKDIWKSVEPIFTAIADQIETLTNNGSLQALIEQIAWIIGVCNDFLAQLIPILTPIIETIIEAISQMKDSGLIENISALVIQLASILQPIINSLITNLWPVLVEISNMVVGIVKNLLDKMQPFFDVLVNNIIPRVADIIRDIMPIIKIICDIVTDVIALLMPFIGPAIDILVTGLQIIVSVVKDVYIAIKAIWDFVKPMINMFIDLVAGLINFIIDGLNILIKGLNLISFDMPDWLGGGHFGFDIREIAHISIPKLAEGGIVNGPTLAQIGEAGSEAVIPLTDPSWMYQLRDILGERDISINVDGQKLGQASIKAINSITKQTGKNQLIMA